jgi:hypothetical protein
MLLRRRSWMRLIPRTVTWMLVIFIVYYLATAPNQAAHLVMCASHGLQSAGNSMSNFVNDL